MRILFLDLDTLRPDHLGCYGYHRNTSPNLDRLAAEGTRFDAYHCSDAPCLPSRAALMTGRFGIHTGVVGHGGTAADLRIEGPEREFGGGLGANSLPGRLRQAGLHTASISPFAERHSAWWFYAGFMEMHNTGRRGGESAEEVTPTALDWIERNAASDDWFLHINYWDPHYPYRAPEEFGNPFEEEPLPQWYTQETIDLHRSLPGAKSAQDVAMYSNRRPPQYPRTPGEVRNMKDFRMMIDGYDCGIRYMDSHIGQLLDALERRGVLDDLVIVVSSDHGENLGEMGFYAEHGTADLITTRIPMIVRGPGIMQGHVDSELHYNLDLAPTLAEWLDQPPADTWDGQSYAETLTQGAECGREVLVLSQCCHGCQRSVRFGPWLYIRSVHDFYHCLPREVLFNVQADPHEERDVAAQHADVCREGAQHLLTWWEDMMKTSPSDADPLWTVMREGGPYHARGQIRRANYDTRLETTGRGHWLPELKRRYPEEFAE